MKLLARCAVLAIAAIPVVIGCSSSRGGDTGDEQDVIPQDTNNLFDQSEVCSLILKRHAGVKDVDLRDGDIRWNCADVPGVTSVDLAKCDAARKAVKDFKASLSGKKPTDADKEKLDGLVDDQRRQCQGFGQEYCEYHAVANGKTVTSLAQANGTPIACVFTSVFQDAEPNDDLAAAMADTKNLGVKATKEIVQMQVGFNSNGAATALIRDCRSQSNPDLEIADPDSGEMRARTAAEKAATKKALVDEPRQAACWLASADASKKDKLTKLCKGKDLSIDANWKPVEALGVKVAEAGDADYETQRDLAACLGSRRAGGVTWRNSDNMICGRTMRAVEECNCDFSPIPDAFNGFILAGWTNDQLPTGCRYAKVGNSDFQNIAICQVAQSEIDDLDGTPTANDLQGFCHDRFSKDIVMKAPVRAALEKKGSCSSAPGFCAAYEGQAK
jgi:hypothetical protein